MRVVQLEFTQQIVVDIMPPLQRRQIVTYRFCPHFGIRERIDFGFFVQFLNSFTVGYPVHFCIERDAVSTFPALLTKELIAHRIQKEMIL